MKPSPCDDSRIVKFDKYAQRGAYHWDECNRKSSSYNPPLVARYRVVIDALSRLEKKSRTLDIGCGDAYLIAQIQHLCDEVFGLDSEPHAVALANQILADWQYCKVVVGSCYELPFEDRSFDVVLLTDVIEHLKQPSNCLAEIARVLTDSGHLIITTPKFRNDRKWDDRHEKEYSPEEFETLLRVYFPHVTVTYFWPMFWSSLYNTRLGWRACKYIARAGWNPFLQESAVSPEKFGQLKAVCCRQE